MKIEKLKINEIIPYWNNPRSNQGAIDKVAESIKEFGIRQPIVVDSEKVIIVGHTRHLAGKKLGLKEFPVHVASELTEKQIKAYRIADNRTNEFAEWDMDKLAIELKGTDDFFSGFEQAENDDKENIQDEINAEAEYMDKYDKAEKREERIKGKIEQIKKKNPGALLDAKLIILDANKGNECLILIDENFTDFVTEIRRYIENGEKSPLEAILSEVHKL